MCLEAEEACEKAKVAAAARALVAQKNLNVFEAELQEAKEDEEVVRANFPQECKKGQE